MEFYRGRLAIWRFLFSIFMELHCRKHCFPFIPYLWNIFQNYGIFILYVLLNLPKLWNLLEESAFSRDIKIPKLWNDEKRQVQSLSY